MISERDMLDMLGRRYTSIREGTLADRWVRAEHVRRRLGHASINYVADFIALDKYPGIPYGSDLEVHWHEVKISRQDWLTELKRPEKSGAFTEFAHRRWLVVSDPKIVLPGELPDGWGLLAPTKKGVLRARAQAPRHTPSPIPLDLTIAIAAAAGRTGARELGRRDAPVAHVRSWDAKCSVCGAPAPCRWHQNRAYAERRA